MKRYAITLIACLFACGAYAVDEIGSSSPIVDPADGKSHTFVKDMDTVHHEPATSVLAPPPPAADPSNKPIAPDNAFENDVTHRARKIAPNPPPPSGSTAGDVAQPPKQ